MSENKYKGKVYNFWQLLKNQKIEIPIIQRDYAQGRKDKQDIRDNFFNALYKSLNDSKPIKLDFIYGSNLDNTFQPLDGQQRLTTLFLLYWYAALKNNSLTEENKGILKKFSYETRISSREFCETLVSNPVNLNSSSKDIRTSIVDSSWFILSWGKDPTIDAMMRSIDDIHKKFQNIENLWGKLTAEDCPITFYHVELENIGLTDDLYIKMNARGKLLSPFENYKATFQKHINDNKWEQTKEFKDTFACKIDTIWTDLFWMHRKANSIDEALMRFTSAIVMIKQSINKSEGRDKNIQNLQENPNSVRADLFYESDFIYLSKCFDIYTEVMLKKLDLSLDFVLWQHKPENNFFSALVYEDNKSSNSQINSASYTQKVLFYAQTEYLKKVPEFNQPFFRDWMRVIRNIVSRGDVTKSGDRPTIIRSPSQFDGVINLVNELSEGCDNIYKFLSSKGSLNSSFATRQIDEERLKAKLIIKNEIYRKVIFDTENNNLLRGRIEFALKCIDYKDDSDNFNLELLEKIQEVFAKYFNNEEISNDFRRAMLTINENGQYKYYEYWWSFWFAASANKRCLIDKYRELEYFIYGDHNYNGYLKSLIIKLIDNDFEQIIINFIPPIDMPNWKVRLIKEAKLLDDCCPSNYFAIPEDESCCYLLKSMRPRDVNGSEMIE